MVKPKPRPHSLIADNLTRIMRTHPQLHSQLALAKRAGVGQTTIGRILRSETDPGTEVVRKLARALQVPVAVLFGEAPEPFTATTAERVAEASGGSHLTRLTPAMIADTYTGLQWPFRLAGLDYDPGGDAQLLVLALTWALDDTPANMAAVNEAVRTIIATRTGVNNGTERAILPPDRRPRAARHSKR